MQATQMDEEEGTESMGDTDMKMEIWKEGVRMDAIQLPRHIHHHWLTDSNSGD